MRPDESPAAFFNQTLSSHFYPDINTFPMKYYINIGSNLGDRRLNISRAVALIEKEFGYFKISKSVESEPWGFDSANPFLNIAMMFHSDMDPVEVLHTLQKVEKAIDPAPHRDAEGQYIDRRIDIDIMAIEQVNKDGSSQSITVDHPELQVPHPHLFDRPFFIGPLRELIDGASGH